MGGGRVVPFHPSHKSFVFNPPPVGGPGGGHFFYQNIFLIICGGVTGGLKLFNKGGAGLLGFTCGSFKKIPPPKLKRLRGLFVLFYFFV